jgi:hypothetical protein
VFLQGVRIFLLAEKFCAHNFQNANGKIFAATEKKNGAEKRPLSLTATPIVVHSYSCER